MNPPARVDRSANVKANIRSAAARLFAEDGYAGTGIRQIADEAGVDKSIVIRHFGSKEHLFIETMSLPAEWEAIMDGALDDLPFRLVRRIAEGGDGLGRGVFIALVRASDSGDVRAALRSGLERIIVAPLVIRLGTPDAPVRAHLFAAALVGLLVAMWVTEDPEICALSPQELARSYGPGLHACLAGVEC